MNHMKTLSKKNPYYISKERKLELIHFCRQYPEWRDKYNSIVHAVNGPRMCATEVVKIMRGLLPRPTEGAVFDAWALAKKMDIVDATAREVNPRLCRAIREGAIYGKSYDEMNALEPLPVSRSEYYKSLRKFFWLLDQKHCISI